MRRLADFKVRSERVHARRASKIEVLRAYTDARLAAFTQGDTTASKRLATQSFDGLTPIATRSRFGKADRILLTPASVT